LNRTKKKVGRFFATADVDSIEVGLQAGSPANTQTDAVSVDAGLSSHSPVTVSATKQRPQSLAKVGHHRHRGVGAARPQQHQQSQHHRKQQQQQQPQAVSHSWMNSACGSRPPDISMQQPNCTLGAVGNSATPVKDVTTLLSDGD